MHVRGDGPRPFPLVITHGWPGSVAEFAKIIGPLTDPARHGGDPADAFDVVAPSMPGYGFSDHARAPGMDAERIAALWAELMRGLGYARFGAQGGDWGAMVSTYLGAKHADVVAGIHLNMVVAFPPDPDEPARRPDAGRGHRHDADAGLPAATRPATSASRARSRRRSATR